MKALAQVLSTSVARAIAVMGAAVFVISAHIAEAGINVWTSHGPVGASVTALAIDPRTPSTLYAGTLDGVFKSTDGASSWQAVNTGFPYKPDFFYGVFALAIDPSTPSTLYAGTLDGVFKSTDGASSWQAVNTGLIGSTDYFDVLALAIDPHTPSTLYAGTLDGVFKSTDAGGSWQAVNMGLISSTDYVLVLALAIDPRTPSTLYAGTLDGVFKSTDAGGSWQAVNAGLTFARAGILALAIDPRTPGTLYAGGGPGDDYGTGVFKSTDGATSWQAVHDATLSKYAHVFALAIDPSTPSTLYAGTLDGVFKSTDGASSWQATGLAEPDITALAIDPNTPSTVYAGTADRGRGGGGVFKIEQVCAGDCDGTGSVTVDEIITLVNIALGNAQASACQHGVPSGAEVNVALIIQAVNAALSGSTVTGTTHEARKTAQDAQGAHR